MASSWTQVRTLASEIRYGYCHFAVRAALTPNNMRISECQQKSNKAIDESLRVPNTRARTKTCDVFGDGAMIDVERRRYRLFSPTTSEHSENLHLPRAGTELTAI